jgi:hypothetical protein
MVSLSNQSPKFRSAKKRLTTFPVISRSLLPYPPPTEKKEKPDKKPKIIIIRQKTKIFS